MPQNPNYTRQRERTVDNLKRLFALVFSLSFAAAGVNFFGRIKPYLIGTDKFDDLTFSAVAMNIEIFLVFAVTAGVFYQGVDSGRGQDRIIRPSGLDFSTCIRR